MPRSATTFRTASLRPQALPEVTCSFGLLGGAGKSFQPVGPPQWAGGLRNLGETAPEVPGDHP